LSHQQVKKIRRAMDFRMSGNRDMQQTTVETNELNAAERKTLSKLDTPAKIQRFLDSEVAYNLEKKGPTCRSPRRVLRDRLAHCIEGALLAAAALRLHGFPPLILDLESVRDDDHVLAVYKRRGSWGAIAKSNYTGLRFREPVYRNLRELVMSYFEHYYNDCKEKTLRRYSRPVNVSRFDRSNWLIAERDLWEIPQYLQSVSHTRILARGTERCLDRMDDRLAAAGYAGADK
jgi:hypothetical protein